MSPAVVVNKRKNFQILNELLETKDIKSLKQKRTDTIL